LLGDPRIPNIKNRLNNVKRRQKFRPFAPAILSEFANEYFEGPMNEYMQFVAEAKHNYEGVTHVDGTARVQLVPQHSRSVFRQVLEEFYEITGVPMLLNTSLNIKGQPMVNNEQDALDFEKKYKVKVF
jgi:carbamoyltransferase